MNIVLKIMNKIIIINNISLKNERKKNANFLNFYNNDDKDLEVNIETRAAIDPKWYENCKNKKAGYVFDKTKLFTCNDEDERTNGANRKKFFLIFYDNYYIIII